MTNAQFDALNELLRAYYVFDVASHGRQHDKPHMEKQRSELMKCIADARRIMVDDTYDEKPSVTE